MIEVKPDRIPEELRTVPQWVLWRTCERNGQATKLPFQVTGAAAKSNDPATWADFDTVLARYSVGNYCGIGFVFSAGDDFCGIDLDGCRDLATGQVAAWAREIIKGFASYAEVSPSETGIKLFIRGKSPFAGGKKRNVDTEPVSDKTPGLEVYDHGRYFAVTGHRLANGQAAVESRQEELNQFCEKWWPEPVAHRQAASTTGGNQCTVADRARAYVAKLPPAISGQSGHNAAFHTACVLVHGFGMSAGEAMPIFEEWNLTCDPPWSEHEMRHKLESAEQQPGERNYLRDVPMQRAHSVRVPTYEAPKPLPEIVTLETAANKYIERIASNDTGLVSLGLADVDYAIGGGVEFGELVVIAARPGHGKSAVGLQIVASCTAAKLPALIISEEMSSAALAKRAIMFSSDVPEEHWFYQLEQVKTQVSAHFSAKAPCFISESVGTIERAATAIRHAVAEHGARVVVIDYAQLLQGKGSTRYEQVTNTSIELRHLASELKLIVVVLVQMSRAIESRTKFSPVLGDIKDSGQIEQDADCVLFLCWPHRYDDSADPHEYIVFVSKNRNRAINSGAVRCKFIPSRQMVLEPQVDVRRDILPAGELFSDGYDPFSD